MCYPHDSSDRDGFDPVFDRPLDRLDILLSRLKRELRKPADKPAKPDPIAVLPGVRIYPAWENKPYKWLHPEPWV